jgi:uncharacterized protein (DUF697 family)
MEDEKLHALIMKSKAHRVTVVNKVDLLDDREQAEFAVSLREKLGLFEQADEDFLFVSAKKNIHIDSLVRHIADILPEAMQDAFIAQQQANLTLKEKRVRMLVYSKATLCAAVALTPLPFADMVVLTPTQIAMIVAIGYFHGVDVTKKRIIELMGILGAGYGLREVARQLTKLIPGAGSIISAAIAFAGTVGLGETANLWFKQQMKVSTEELREVFTAKAENARKEYEAHREAAHAAAEHVKDLEEQRKAGKINDDQFVKMLDSLIDTSEKSAD